MRTKAIDILSVGELLIDMISTDFADSMDAVESYRRIPGGSPSNLGMNMKRLGNNVRLVSSVGKDGFGDFLMNYIKSLGLNTEGVAQIPNVPTTLILVTRSKTVSDFEAYRGADTHILPSQISNDLLANTAIFHTTCFALSLNPAQNTILDAASRATALGCRLSIDVNYAQKIWQNNVEAREIVAKYISHGAYVKCSEVDWERLYGEKLTDAEAAAQHFLALGAGEVCVTLGGDGCYVANKEGGYFLNARKVEVKDTTGAGDAFWSGYLTARLDGFSLIEAAKAARKMAETKIGHFGPLPNKVEKALIYSDI
ncbi:MAG: carbohydrate kinase [Saprospiraceae bacterium]|nr:carbohydrate kinase [Saprospiraceae bacterium]